MKTKIVGIYKITSPSCRVYIGQSNDIYARFNKYKRYGCKRQTSLYASFIKYGVDKHVFEIIETCLPEQLDSLEIKYIQLHDSTNKKNGLNLKEGGAYGTHNKETRDKIGKAHKGKIVSPEARKRMSDSQRNIHDLKSEIASKWQTGRKLSASHKANIGKAHQGNNYRLGKKTSDETKRLISEASKGHKRNLGKKKSEAEKKRLSELHKGKPKSKEQKIKMSMARRKWHANKLKNTNQLSINY